MRDHDDILVLSRIDRAKNEDDARYARVFPYDSVVDQRRFNRLYEEGLVDRYDTAFRPLAGQVLKLTPAGAQVLASHRQEMHRWRGLAAASKAKSEALTEQLRREARNRAGGGAPMGIGMRRFDEIFRGEDPIQVGPARDRLGRLLGDFYASQGIVRRKWVRALDTLSTGELLDLARLSSEYGTAAGIEMKDTIGRVIHERPSRR